MKVKLNKTEVRGVRNWLDNKLYYECPFLTVLNVLILPCNVEVGDPHRVCKSWFPQTITLKKCPCSCYALSTVIRKAKEMIK